MNMLHPHLHSMQMYIHSQLECCGVLSMHALCDAQLHLQDEMEPICIDSDDDVHARGSGPAREGNQNGAAIATRHSTRSNRPQSTTQRFKVMLPPPNDAKLAKSNIV